MKYQFSVTRRAAVSAVLIATLAGIVGCEDGPKRFTVSGSVTLGGKPVKAGEVSFEPDSSKGNRGPGSIALIKEGKFSTEPGMGVIGGAYIVRIVPLTGIASAASMDGDAILSAPYEMRVEFPTSDTTKDFDIPANAVKPKK